MQLKKWSGEKLSETQKKELSRFTIEHRLCLNCHKEFINKRHDQNCCTRKCEQGYWRKNHYVKKDKRHSPEVKIQFIMTDEEWRQKYESKYK